jgi:6-phosphogluconolactonase
VTRWTVLRDAEAVATATADRFIAAARDAIAGRGIFRVALSGGPTPPLVYPRILDRHRRDTVDWGRAEFFWGDERSVPPDHPESNFGVAYEMLISQLPGVPAARIHRMRAEAKDIAAAARSYERELRLAFDAHGHGVPQFDLIWLGMGQDGHTASLFPGTEALHEERRWVVGNWVPDQETWRMTLTFPVLRAGRQVIVTSIGADRSESFRAIRAGGSGLPGEQISGHHVEWIVDAAAAGEA